MLHGATVCCALVSANATVAILESRLKVFGCDGQCGLAAKSKVSMQRRSGVGVASGECTGRSKVGRAKHKIRERVEAGPHVVGRYAARCLASSKPSNEGYQQSFPSLLFSLRVVSDFHPTIRLPQYSSQRAVTRLCVRATRTSRVFCCLLIV